MKNKMLTTLLTLALSPMALGAGYTAHEWGTFTSVVNKDGKMIQGLHHEEEALPNFVYDLSRVEQTRPNIDLFNILTTEEADKPVEPTPRPRPRPRPTRPPMTRGFTPASMDLMPIPTFTERITQKMETPVIYFYADKEIDVNVKVDFPKGVISQWYPKVSSINPSEEAKNGYAIWDVKVLNKNTDELPETSGNSIWNPSREVNSNVIQTGSEKEKLIFYRGLADFSVPLTITEDQGRLTISNNSNQDIHGVTVLNHQDGKNVLGHIKTIAAQSKKKVLLHGKTDDVRFYDDFSNFLAQAKEIIVRDLVASGLFLDESVAMVKTWENGYFQTKGLRVLYVLPREWTDEILPLTMSPAPSNLVRTLVGRVEVLTESDDVKIKEFANTKIKNNEVSSLDVNGREMMGLGHFPEPKLRRALEFDIDESIKEKINKLITTMNQGF